jgi:hypothetical protein
VTPSRHAVKVVFLENGDHFDQPTFHARYSAMPESFKAELIGGVVYVASPLRNSHGTVHLDVATWLGNYRINTPGVVGFLHAPASEIGYQRQTELALPSATRENPNGAE